MDRDSFIQHVAAPLGVLAPRGARALRTVHRVLTEALPAGQIADLVTHLPKDLAAFLERGATRS